MIAPPVTINGADYYTVKVFAHITRHSEQSIRFLITYGNKQRKLLATKILGRPMIPASELTAFPFTCSGRAARVYHIAPDGSQVYE